MSSSLIFNFFFKDQTKISSRGVAQGKYSLICFYFKFMFFQFYLSTFDLFKDWTPQFFWLLSIEFFKLILKIVCIIFWIFLFFLFFVNFVNYIIKLIFNKSNQVNNKSQIFLYSLKTLVILLVILINFRHYHGLNAPDYQSGKKKLVSTKRVSPKISITR